MKQSTKNQIAQIIIEKIKWIDSGIDYVDISWGTYDTDIQAQIADTMQSNKLHPTKRALIEMRELIFQRMEAQYIIKKFRKTFVTGRIGVFYPDPEHIQVKIDNPFNKGDAIFDFYVPNKSTYDYVFTAEEYPAIIFPIINQEVL